MQVGILVWLVLKRGLKVLLVVGAVMVALLLMVIHVEDHIVAQRGSVCEQEVLWPSLLVLDDVEGLCRVSVQSGSVPP